MVGIRSMESILKTRVRSATLFRFAAVPALLLFLLIGMNLWLARLEPQWRLFSNTDTFVWHEKVNLLAGDGLAAAPLLVLGDSQAMSGVLAADLDAGAYNLGLPSQQPEGLLALANQLAHAPRAGRILISISPYSLFKSDVLRAFQTYFRSALLPRSAALLVGSPTIIGDSAGEALEFLLLQMPLYQVHQLGFLYGSFEQRLPEVPLQMVRRQPKFVNLPATDRFLTSGWEPLAAARAQGQRNQMVRRILKDNRGFWTWQAFGDTGPGSCSPSGRSIPGAPPVKQTFANRPEARVFWRKVMLSLKRQGREVHLIQLPFSDAWERSTYPDEVYRRLDQALIELGNDFAQAPGTGTLRIHPRPRWDSADARLFHDWTHLSFCGARRYTHWLSARLSK